MTRAELEQVYLRAVYEVRDAAGNSHACTFEPPGDGSGRLPFRMPWLLITAWNPGSVRASDADNHAAQEHLREAISVLGLTAHPAVGRDAAVPPAWREDSLLVENIKPNDALRLLKTFRQTAGVYVAAWRAGLLFTDPEEWRAHPLRIL